METVTFQKKRSLPNYHHRRYVFFHRIILANNEDLILTREDEVRQHEARNSNAANISGPMVQPPPIFHFGLALALVWLGLTLALALIWLGFGVASRGFGSALVWCLLGWTSVQLWRGLVNWLCCMGAIFGGKSIS